MDERDSTKGVRHEPLLACNRPSREDGSDAGSAVPLAQHCYGCGNQDQDAHKGTGSWKRRLCPNFAAPLLPPSVSEKFSLRTRCMSRCAFASSPLKMGEVHVPRVSAHEVVCLCILMRRTASLRPGFKGRKRSKNPPNRLGQSAAHELPQFKKEGFNVVPTVFFASRVRVEEIQELQNGSHPIRES